MIPRALPPLPDCRRWQRIAALTALAFALVAVGCGPAGSSAAVADAARLRAEVLREPVQRYAAYELARGDAFLRQARLASARSDHDGAIALARTARSAFLQARQTARANMRKKHFPPYALDWEREIGAP